MSYLFTSESVSEGHPDKVSDQISDGILDNFLAFDPNSKVACETLVTTGQVVLSGEVTSSTYIDVQNVAREIIKDIGYNNDLYKFSGESCAVMSLIHEQSEDILRGVERDTKEDQGAGDQGIMFGYACTETTELMPAPIYYSHKILELMAKGRKDGSLKGLEPDSKSQVTLKYVNGQPSAVTSVVISTQHAEGLSPAAVKEIVTPVLNESIPANLLDGLSESEYYVNPTGNFVIILFLLSSNPSDNLCKKFP